MPKPRNTCQACVFLDAATYLAHAAPQLEVSRALNSLVKDTFMFWNRRSRLALVFVSVTIPVVLLTARAQEPAAASQKRAAFMRQKLEFSKAALEGLTKDDLAAVADAASKLKRLSAAAEWEVPTIPDVEQYLPMTTEFQRRCDEMAKQAKAKNIDGATLAYVQLTINCVNCHKYIRTPKE
jgi:hypothetical protein